MILGVPWWLYLVLIVAGSALGAGIACGLAAGWGLLLGLLDLWRQRRPRDHRPRNRW